MLCALSFGVVGCSQAAQTMRSGSNQAENTANSMGTLGSQTPAGSNRAANVAGANATGTDATGINSTAGAGGATGVANTAGSNGLTSRTVFNGDVQSVIAGIQAEPAQMLTTVNARVSGQPFGKGMAAVTFASQSVGYLAGRGIVLKTTDGGQVFLTSYRANVNFTGVSLAKGSNHTVAAWASHRIVVSHNGGATWKRESLPTNAAVQQVDFVTRSEGFAISGNTTTSGTLWQTTDGGADWSTIATPAAPASVSFGSATTGWIGLHDGDIYETTNSGSSWTRVFHPSDKYAGQPQVHAVDDHAAWAMVIGGSGMSQTSYSVFRTQDGSHWFAVLGVGTAGAGPAPDSASDAPKGPGSSPGPMVALSSDEAVVMGTCEACGMGTGQVSATLTGGVSWTTHPTIENSMSLPTSASFVSVSDGWVLEAAYNGGSVLLHTTDGGQTWHEVYPMVHPSPVEGVSFLNSHLGFGLGTPGNANAVLKSTNGGHTWRQVATLPAKTVQRAVTVGNSAIDFTSQADGYAIGSDGNVYKTADGGETWTAVLDGTQQQPFSSITFVQGGQDGLAAGYGATADVTVNGGQTWRVVQMPTTADSTAQVDLYLAGLAHLPTAATLKTLLYAETPGWLAAQTGKLAFVPGQNGQSFFMTSDGGAHWHNIDFGNQYPNPFALDFVNVQDGWMITVRGSLLRTTNGGQTWRYVSH